MYVLSSLSESVSADIRVSSLPMDWLWQTLFTKHKNRVPSHTLVCVCVRVCVCVCTRTCVCTCVFVHACMATYIGVCVCVCVYVHVASRGGMYV